MAGGANYVYGLGGAGPHAVSQVGAKLYSYDANGAMVSGNGKTTTWTSFNKPRKIEDTLTGDKAEFVYGPGRARIKQQIVDNSLLTDVIYVGSLFEKKIHPGDDDELVHYIRAGGAVVAIYTRYDDGYGFTDKTRYLHRDHLGSVESVTDETGALTERTSYDPHGKRRLADWQAGTPATPGETPRGFTGHEHLDTVGLIHMNGRVYDPTLGRFLSADPFVKYPETTQGFNRYSYTDPSGFSIFGEDGGLAETPNDSAGPGAGQDDRGLLERIDDALSDLLGVDKKARDIARTTGANYWDALKAVNTGRAINELSKILGGTPAALNEDVVRNTITGTLEKFGLTGIHADIAEAAAMAAAMAAVQGTRELAFSNFGANGRNGISGAGGADSVIGQAGGPPGQRQRLTYSTYSGGPGTTWRISWQLTVASPKGGWIVQVVRSAGWVNGEKVSAKYSSQMMDAVYWEAWQVLPGEKRPVGSKKYDDTFMLNPLVSGYVSFSTEAIFYEDLALPLADPVTGLPKSAFGFRPFPEAYAGSLPATTADPNFPTNNATMPVRREWYTNQLPGEFGLYGP